MADIIANRYELAERELARQRKLREKLMLSRFCEQYRQALRVRTRLSPELKSRLTPRECAILEKHAHWMEQLASGKLQPISMAQVHFIPVVKGLAEPKSEYRGSGGGMAQKLCLGWLNLLTFNSSN